MPSFGSQLISISESMQSYFASESVSPSDRLTQHFSTKDYILSPSLQINSNSYSIPSIESSFDTPFTESVGPIEPTPIHWPSVTIESDKNSISGSLTSFSISKNEDIVSHSTKIPFITSMESSLGLTTVSVTPSKPSKQIQSQSINKTIESLPSTRTPAPTTTPVPLCPQSLQTRNPRESLEKPFEDYLIRTGITF